MFARLAFAIGCGLYAAAAVSAPDEYQLRNAQRDRATFAALDRNKDGLLTLAEVQGDIDMQARFDDFDVNRDGVIDRAELARYIAAHHALTKAPA